MKEGQGLQKGEGTPERGKQHMQSWRSRRRRRWVREKKKVGEGQGKSSPEPSTHWGGDNAEISQGGARLGVLWMSGL